MHDMLSLSDQVKSIFLTSNFTDGKNIQFTIYILSKPTLSITVTETALKAQGSRWWETEMMEVESRCQTILLSAHCTLTKAPQSLLSYLGHYNRYIAFTHDSRTHRTSNRREYVWRQKLVATMNDFTMTNGSCLRNANVYRKLHPHNCTN